MLRLAARRESAGRGGAVLADARRGFFPRLLSLISEKICSQKLGLLGREGGKQSTLAIVDPNSE